MPVSTERIEQLTHLLYETAIGRELALDLLRYLQGAHQTAKAEHQAAARLLLLAHDTGSRDEVIRSLVPF